MSRKIAHPPLGETPPLPTHVREFYGVAGECICGISHMLLFWSSLIVVGLAGEIDGVGGILCSNFEHSVRVGVENFLEISVRSVGECIEYVNK